jgi:hypothetical protein
VGVWSAPPRADEPCIIFQITRRAKIKEGNESQGNTSPYRKLYQQVPHPGDECGDQFAVQSDGCKNPRREVIGVTNGAANATKHSIRGKEKNDLPILTKKDTMLDKGSRSQTPNGVFPSSRDSGGVTGKGPFLLSPAPFIKRGIF